MMKKIQHQLKRKDTDFTSALVDDVKGMKIGIPKDYFGEGLDHASKRGGSKRSRSFKDKRCYS